jgi:hypothetical protein
MGHSYLLFLRYLLVNAVAIAVLVAAFLQGWVTLIYESDLTYLSVVMSGLFLFGLTSCTLRTWRTSREINIARGSDRATDSRTTRYIDNIGGKDAGSRATLASALRLNLFSRISYIRHIANSLVVLGLIGTVIGFIIALSGVDPDIATNPSAVSPMVARLIEGMSVALYTTLVGAILSVWLNVCYQMLATGTVNLLTAVVELGENLAQDG